MPESLIQRLSALAEYVHGCDSGSKDAALLFEAVAALEMAHDVASYDEAKRKLASGEDVIEGPLKQPDTLIDCQSAFEQWASKQYGIFSDNKEWARKAWEAAWDHNLPTNEDVKGIISSEISLLNPNMSEQGLRLHMGEMTAQEARTARAAIRWANSVAKGRTLIDARPKREICWVPVPDEDVEVAIAEAIAVMEPKTDYCEKGVPVLKDLKKYGWRVMQEKNQGIA